LREIKAGVANGDFAIPPLDPLATIVQDGNPLPYWTFTDVNSAGAITAAIVADSTAASGNKLTFTIASGTLTGKSATLTRYVAIPSSRSRSFSFYAEAHFFEGTASTQARATVVCQFYTSELVATGGTFSSLNYTFGDLQGVGQGVSAPNLYEYLGTPNLANTSAPSDAAFLKVTITIETVATQSAARTVSLTEVRINSGLPELLFTDKNQPGTRNPARITNQDAIFGFYDGSGNSKLYLSNVSGVAAGITTTQSIGITAGNSVLISAPNGTEVSADLIVDGGGSVAGALDVNGNINLGVSDTSTAGALVFKGGAGGSIRAFSAAAGNDSIGVYNTSGSAFGFLVAENFYPGGQGSAFITHDGNFKFNDTVDVTGAITATSTITSAGFNSSGTITNTNGSYYADTPATTTQTSSAAIWVLSTGTNYQLRRNSSSARYKTAITDADEAVLAAAKSIKPRHYESTIADENGATRLGFIAEEVHDAGLTHAVGYDAEGRPESLDSTALIAALWHRVNDLEARLAAIEAER
jgi:hypothetical protein